MNQTPAAGESPGVTLALALIECSRIPVLLLDEDLRIVGASGSFCDAFELEPAVVGGANLAGLGHGEWNVPQLRSLLRATFAEAAALDAYELDLIREGYPPACLVLTAHKLDYDGTMPLVLLSVADVTSARLAKKMRDDLIEEKRVLLLELQHRVANSLQIIASVIMQSARRVQSEETKLHLRNAHHRVISVATLQRQLAVSTDDRIQLREYFQGLCDSIGASMIDDEGSITLHSTADGSSATANVATSLGLIVTELVINALKHAFPDPSKAGEISVDYQSLGEGFTLTVSDNGVGVRGSAQPTEPGLGSGIVEALAKHLGATVDLVDADPGTKVTVIRED